MDTAVDLTDVIPQEDVFGALAVAAIFAQVTVDTSGSFITFAGRH